MRTKLIVIFVIFAVAGLVLAAQLGAFQGQDPGSIPLNTAYATFHQDGLKALDATVDNDDLRQMLDEIQAGPQRIVLCLGKDISGAVKNSRVSFSMPERPVADIITGVEDTMWLAAFLGSDGSIPPAYKVRAIEVTGKTIRVSYERDESSGRTCDLCAYLIWAPLGRMEAGVYTLELFDALAGNVTETRPWQVTVK
jgi:mannose/fructose-specific phosphotransferase system component IIA